MVLINTLPDIWQNRINPFPSLIVFSITTRFSALSAAAGTSPVSFYEHDSYDYDYDNSRYDYNIPYVHFLYSTFPSRQGTVLCLFLPGKRRQRTVPCLVIRHQITSRSAAPAPRPPRRSHTATVLSTTPILYLIPGGWMLRQLHTEYTAG